MRIILIAIAFSWLCTGKTFAEEVREPRLLPLGEYLAKQDRGDAAVLEYALTRCSALFLTISIILDDAGDGNETTSEGFLESSARALGQIVLIKNWYDQKDPTSKATQAIAGIKDFYIEEAQKNYMRTGEYFSSSVIGGDLNFCLKLFASNK